ncbi:MAG: hypothetical protein IPN29_10180 [Saprospiraceae bacterium]|nr:hypothetical protein [Saprospiraceae bacterium]
MIRFSWLFVIFFFSSCLKNSEEFTPYTDKGDVEFLLEKLKNNQHTALIDPSIENTLVTSNNEVLIVPANVLMYEDGREVSGSVILSYSIHTKRGADLAYNRDTKSGETDLQALFDVNLNFSQGSAKVFINPSKSGVIFYIPYSFGNDNAIARLYSWHNNDWQYDTEGETSGKLSSESWKIDWENGTIFGLGYKVELKRVGSSLVALPFIAGNTIKLCVELPENYSPKNTVVFAVMPDEKLTRKLAFSNGSFCSGKLGNGSLLKIVTLSEQEGKYYLAEGTYRSSGNLNITMVPKPKTIEEILEVLNGI